MHDIADLVIHVWYEIRQRVKDLNLTFFNDSFCGRAIVNKSVLNYFVIMVIARSYCVLQIVYKIENNKQFDYE